MMNATTVPPSSKTSEGDKDKMTPQATSRFHGGLSFNTAPSARDDKSSVGRFRDGPLLRTAEWLSNSMAVPPAGHRFDAALGLTGGLWSGMSIMDNALGVTLRDGKAVKLEDYNMVLRPIFKPFHNKLGKAYNYNFYGMETHNRVLKLAHHMVPAGLGLFGLMMGSQWYFHDRQEKLQHPEYIDDYAGRVAFDQSKPWAWLSGISSLANVGLGLNFLPFSYGMNIGMRFTLASDRRIIFPGMKEAINNHHSIYPYGSARLRDYMIQYLTKNPDREPRQIYEMSRAIIEPWFGPQSPTVITSFANKALAIRNEFYEPGGVPQKQWKACSDAIKKEFVGEGLHRTFAELGLDVLQANIDDTGLIGRFAETLGARKAVERDIKEFRQKEVERRTAHPELIPHPVIATQSASSARIAEKDKGETVIRG